MVVGIGASAGGLKALQQFVEAVPASSGMAFVVIVHLDPERESRMSELLQDRTDLPVQQVTEPTQVKANHIYIIPPGQDLAMSGGTLVLRPRGMRSAHAPVDLLFRTLAEEWGPDAAGVVLSGTGSDGTAGIRYIREAGGMTGAQSPEEAEYSNMPASAISTGLVDFVMPASRIPAELERVRRNPTVLLEDAAGTPDTEAGLTQVLAVLRKRTGHDFSLYKPSTVIRRLHRRLRFNHVTTLVEYLAVLESNAGECQALLSDLLISVSSFFRDPEAFDALGTLVPSLFEGKGPEAVVRAWVVGCATGEEVYSVAMVLEEHAATLAEAPRIQIFATDIDERGYSWARAGLYTEAAVASITPERLGRFFTKEAGGYRIAKSLREVVLFAGHNVLHDAPFSRMDLISCRNLFIYLNPEAQERVLETFHFALNPGGLLFLGASESVGDNRLFVGTGRGEKRLYRRSATQHRVIPRLSTADPEERPRLTPGNDDVPGKTAPTKQPFSYGALHVRMLEQYAPASVIVDEHLDVVHLSAGAGRFLHMAEGEPSQNFLDLVRTDLRNVLRTALHYALEKGTPTTREVRLDIDGREQEVSVQVRPSAADLDAPGRFALIVFEVTADQPSAAARVERPVKGDASAVIELEEELRQAKDMLETSSVEHDRTVSELQMLNEELRSINEEQTASAEELETGREEIQSINEELTTVNQEYQSTIEELKRTNADLQNLIESTEIGTIFLDRAMRIRRFTPAVASIFNFVAEDQGRALGHITHRLKYDEMMADVAGVLESLERIERVVSCDTGESYIVRINPYRSMDGGADGVVLTFFDNSIQQQAQEDLREAKKLADAANLAKGTFLSTLSHEFRTPLNAILGYADLLSIDGPLNAEQEKKVERIKAGGWHLASMIDEVLGFAKLDGGQEEVRSEPLDARSIAREAGVLVEPTAIAKGLKFFLDVPDDEVPLKTDRAKAVRILVNLCGNAVTYTETGEVRLAVRSDPDQVVFEVHDTGIGIAPEHHGRIFDRFWQVDGSSGRKSNGMGIGLAAAREYALLLGGDVKVESKLGEGSTFHVWLPNGDGPT
ncbi:MAG TPA: chemotaxis protein CheB [Longimicrobiales bacterium]|nr:chemotaxis protein CheB [Longimicrobiales bacterium]